MDTLNTFEFEMLVVPSLGLLILVLVGLAILLGVLLRRGDKQKSKALEEIKDLAVEHATRFNTLELELAHAKESIAHKDEQLNSLQSRLDKESEKYLEASKHVQHLETSLSAQNKFAEEKLSLLNASHDSLKLEFKNLANSILEEKSAKFTEQNKSNLDALMNPLREQLKDFKQRVEDTYDKESKDRISLFEQVKQLQVLNTRLSEDAHKLTSALKGNSKTQGDWGELILERILEQSGLEKGREYDTQLSFTKKDLESREKRYKPDVIIHLPEKKSIIVDAKVSLTAYEKYCSLEDEKERSLALKEHLLAVKARINELAEKNYHDLDGVHTLDFVVMFMPIEAAFLLAMQSDSQLYQYAMDKNIFIVSPSNLLVMLRVVNHTWRNEKQNLNAQKIADNAGKLYDKFVGFTDDMEKIGQKIQQSDEAWQASMKKLKSGTGNLIKRAEDLKTLGAKTNKALHNSDAFLESDLDD